MPRDHAIRRHHKDRMTRRVLGMGKFRHCACPQKFADTRQPCSCHGCGNPRRWWKGRDRITMQERRVACPEPEDIDVYPSFLDMDANEPRDDGTFEEFLDFLDWIYGPVGWGGTTIQ